MDEAAAAVESHPEVHTEIPETEEPCAETPIQAEEIQKRKRGRPSGSKNKVNISVVPLSGHSEPPPEAAETLSKPEPVAEPAPKKRVRVSPPAPEPKVVVVPQAPAPTPHETFRMAMQAMTHLAQLDRAHKQEYYTQMVSRMVR